MKSNQAPFNKKAMLEKLQSLQSEAFKTKSPEDIKALYKGQALELLASFQLLEQSLKMYICAVNRAVQALVKGKLVFKFEDREVESYPLERLIGLFQKLSDDESLVCELNALRRLRNDVAHNSLLAVSSDKNFDNEEIFFAGVDFWVREGDVKLCIESILSKVDEVRKFSI
jgi:hypothetical protein